MLLRKIKTNKKQIKCQYRVHFYFAAALTHFAAARVSPMESANDDDMYYVYIREWVHCDGSTDAWHE